MVGAMQSWIAREHPIEVREDKISVGNRNLTYEKPTENGKWTAIFPEIK